jgi:hypothetical protein
MKKIFGLKKFESFLGCDFSHTNTHQFQSLFLFGNLRSPRYNICYPKGVRDDMFGDEFFGSLIGLEIKMVGFY